MGSEQLVLPADFTIPVVNSLIEAIGEATVGAGTWDDFVQMLGEAVLGSCVNFQSIDLRSNSLRYDRIYNIEPEAEKSYRQYYHRVNQWIQPIRAAPSGTVVVSERDCPSRNFADTEFGDWLMPELAAAAAVSLGSNADNLIFLGLNYSIGLAASYDPLVSHILTNISKPLQRSHEMMQVLEHTLNREVSGAAISGRPGDIALVVDAGRCIVDANPRAEAELCDGILLSGRAGRLSLLAREPDSWLDTTIRQMAAGMEPSATKVFFADGKCQIALYPIPRSLSRRTLLPRSPLFLVVVRNLTATRMTSLGEFATAFGLTPAEQRLCEILQTDCTLRDAADILEIAIDTVRQRLKVIFQKTDTHRQSELISLFNRLI